MEQIHKERLDGLSIRKWYKFERILSSKLWTYHPWTSGRLFEVVEWYQWLQTWSSDSHPQYRYQIRESDHLCLLLGNWRPILRPMSLREGIAAVVVSHAFYNSAPSIYCGVPFVFPALCLMCALIFAIFCFSLWSRLSVIV